MHHHLALLAQKQGATLQGVGDRSERFVQDNIILGVVVGGMFALAVLAATTSASAYRMNPAPEGPVVRKEDYEVKEVVPDGAIREFVKSNHYSKSVGNTWSHVFAMFDRSTGELVGVAWWMPSMPEAHKSAVKWVASTTGLEGDRKMVLHLSRLVVAPGMPKNAAGRLLGQSMRLLDRRKYPILLTYADSGVSDARTGEAHKGTVYKATNWIDTGDAPGGRVWVHSITGEQRGQKRGNINISSADMRAMGYVQKASLPKRRFIHVDERALRWAIARKNNDAPSSLHSLVKSTSSSGSLLGEAQGLHLARSRRRLDRGHEPTHGSFTAHPAL